MNAMKKFWLSMMMVMVVVLLGSNAWAAKVKKICVEEHIVSRGDSLWKIGFDNGLSLEQVLKLNPQYRSDPSHILPGQKVCLKKELLSELETREAILRQAELTRKSQDKASVCFQDPPKEEIPPVTFNDEIIVTMGVDSGQWKEDSLVDVENFRMHANYWGQMDTAKPVFEQFQPIVQPELKPVVIAEALPTAASTNRTIVTDTRPVLIVSLIMLLWGLTWQLSRGSNPNQQETSEPTSNLWLHAEFGARFDVRVVVTKDEKGIHAPAWLQHTFLGDSMSEAKLNLALILCDPRFLDIQALDEAMLKDHVQLVVKKDQFHKVKLYRFYEKGSFYFEKREGAKIVRKEFASLRELLQALADFSYDEMDSLVGFHVSETKMNPIFRTHHIGAGKVWVSMEYEVTGFGFILPCGRGIVGNNFSRSIEQLHTKLFEDGELLEMTARDVQQDVHRVEINVGGNVGATFALKDFLDLSGEEPRYRVTVLNGNGQPKVETCLGIKDVMMFLGFAATRNDYQIISPLPTAVHGQALHDASYLTETMYPGSTATRTHEL